jgi:hypothetical protein
MELIRSYCTSCKATTRKCLKNSEAIFLAFYRDLRAPISTKTNDNDWARFLNELDHLQSVDTDLHHPTAAVVGASLSK